MSHLIEQKIEAIEKHIQAQCLNTKDFLTLAEASIYVGVSKSYLYKLTSKNKIIFYKPDGKLIYFSREELTKWILSNRIATEEEIASNQINLLNNKNSK